MESILEYVRRRLKESGSDKWEEIAHAAGCAPSTPRKVVYERENPGVNTVEPLYRYFLALDTAAPTSAPAPEDASAPPAEEVGPHDRRSFDVSPPVTLPHSGFGDLDDEPRGKPHPNKSEGA
jgi:hypothetical protein